MPNNPTPTQRLNDIQPRLEAIEQVLSIRPAKPSNSWFTRAWKTMSAHKTATVIIVPCFVTILLAIATIWIPRWLDQRKLDFNDAVDHRIENTLKAPGGVIDTLGKVQETNIETNATLKALQPLINDLVRHEFDNVSKLSPRSLEGKLAAVKDLIQVANIQNIQVEPQLSDNLGKNLLRVPSSTPGYWPTASQLIAYRSAHADGKSVPGNQACKNLSINIDRETGPKPEDIDTHIEVSNCTFDLENNFNFRNGGFPQAKYLVLKNVRVRYSGGSTIGLPPTIVFDHCIFEFHIEDQPPIPVQHLTNALLAISNDNTLTYSPK